ncbi:MAG: hypothetical protein JAY69_13530, partial [Candidatus Thiodiazotropha taylori]|nr:hypothetical protein [Candidatus Thiodiazotropha taylori]MCW4233640.1 hypothetical protein [Candidatus Thiodiazotropha taylori]
MTLTGRLLILVLAIVTTMLISGAYLALGAARENINYEVESSARITMQLLTAALISGHTEDQVEAQQILITHLQSLDDTRHLQIAVIRGEGRIIYPISEQETATSKVVPQWFYELVKPAP